MTEKGSGFVPWEVEDKIRSVVHESRERNTQPIPDRNEVLTVRCAYCMRTLKRPRRVIEKMNGRDGFVSCSNPCRRNKKAENERVLIAYPEREP